MLGVATGPWFRRRPVLALAVAVALFAGVVALRLADGLGADGVSGLCVLPIALLAVAFGLRAGVVAGLAGVAVLGVWGGPLLLLGVLLGYASDRLNDAAVLEQRLAAMTTLQRESAEINDTVVQGIAAAKWLIEAGRVDEGLEELTHTMVSTQAIVAEILGSRSR